MLSLPFFTWIVCFKVQKEIYVIILMFRSICGGVDGKASEYETNG